MKAQQLVRLLAGIPYERWRLGVGLMACFGLRPVEQNHIRSSGKTLTSGRPATA
jgi:hypothetical protein